VPIDPTHPHRLREHLVSLQALQQAAAVRATHPPRIGPEAWRGPAFDAYGLAADQLADELRSIVVDLARAQSLARSELARALH
jgi:hypothetical protein